VTTALTGLGGARLYKGFGCVESITFSFPLIQQFIGHRKNQKKTNKIMFSFDDVKFGYTLFLFFGPIV
jgi:hypothetical protein